MEPKCVSINIGPVAGASQKCELNNPTEENHTPFRLVNKPDYTFLAIKNPCSSRPCLNNGTCQAGFTNKGFRCICRERFTGETCQVKVKRNCAEIYISGEKTDGMYTVKPDNFPAFNVYCDQTIAGGGWTVFQKRLDGSVDFYRDWTDYKCGFGDLNGEFWLGLDKIHRLTSHDNNILRVDLEDFEGNTVYAEYRTFRVKSEKDKFRLIRGSYSGNASNSLPPSRPFTTKDQDNDHDRNRNCAIVFKGAWWYNACHASNLNGLYLRGKHSSYADGVNWKSWKGYHYSLKRTEMKIRPVDF
ncbi:Fibrinogen C domain-containing protein 1 [Stylophora pistillata]|uniref:Fibrinogen C domain-containing protein 1 n=2 Tax=Stylophora pistillata TaxID=50429 RepID=A0A2B4SXJ3_STYPI|nr:Fibrinogen C domain-containing protein 1 [Stylophora pistillata]